MIKPDEEQRMFARELSSKLYNRLRRTGADFAVVDIVRDMVAHKLAAEGWKKVSGESSTPSIPVDKL